MKKNTSFTPVENAVEGCIDNVLCGFCGAKIERTVGRKRLLTILAKGTLTYCSPKCSEKARALRDTHVYTIQCSRCGKDAVRKGKRSAKSAEKRVEQGLPVYCSRGCKGGVVGPYRGICTYCSKSFIIENMKTATERRRSEKNGRRSYCSLECAAIVNEHLGHFRPILTTPNTPEDRLVISQRILGVGVRDKIMRHIMKEMSERLDDLTAEQLKAFRNDLMESSKAVGDTALFKFLVDRHDIVEATKAFTIDVHDIDKVYECKNIIMTKLRKGDITAKQAKIAVDLLMTTKELDLLKPVTDSMKNK